MKSLRLACPLSSMLAVLLASTVCAAAPIVVYDDALQNQFEDWSWATHDLQSASSAHGGSHGISANLSGFSGVFLHRPTGWTADAAIDFWVRRNDNSSSDPSFAVLSGSTPLMQVSLSSVAGSLPQGTWVHVQLNHANLGGTPDGLWLQGDATGPTSISIDDIVINTGGGTPPGQIDVTVSIDPSLDRHPVSSWVYGVNFADDLTAVKYPVNRWGGNSTTRYSWRLSASNRAADWFFFNIADDVADPGKLPFGSESDAFVSSTLAAGSVPLLTIPMIGWAPKSRQKLFSYSQAKYGPQTNNECIETGGASWCTEDAGNGILQATGKRITNNDPHDTSVEAQPSEASAWMEHLSAQFGTASTGGVRHYMLDNEVTLWDSTHPDVHPNPVGYDELWSKTLTYAKTIKAADPAAETMGPSAWGWCAYFWSGIDDCGNSPTDRVAHGNKPLLEWYLDQNCAEKTKTGVRPVDWLDIHWYPQNGEYSDDESAATATRRLQSLKSLYDPAWVDQSWIAQPVRLIPRMKELIAGHCPGMKLSLTEYNFGGVQNDNGISAALAQAEALAIMGREGVDLATRWVAPQAGSKVEQAFRLFLDYDGAKSAVAGDSVRAMSSNVDAVGSYAIDGASKTYVVLVNKATDQANVKAAIANGGTATASVYRFDATTSLGPAGTVAVDSGAAQLALPPRSATLVVVPHGTGGSGGAGGSGGDAGIEAGSGGTGGSIDAGAGGGAGGTSGADAGEAGAGGSTGVDAGDAGAGGSTDVDGGEGGAAGSQGGAAGSQAGSGGAMAGSGGASPGTGGQAGAAGSAGAGGTQPGAGGAGGGTPDAGSSATAGDAGEPPASADDASGDDSGCGCRTEGSANTNGSMVLLAMSLAAALLRRRR